MSNCWEILGIEPTNNKKAIRSAYAAKSKLYHPEEDQEAFVTLNQAYQAALGYASAKTQNVAPLQQTGVFEQLTKTQSLKESSERNELDASQKLKQEGAEEEQTESERQDVLTSSLLSRLQQAEQKQTELSLQKGALKRLIDIFEAAKESGKVPRAIVWQEFFLSEEFLKEQYSDAFADGMMQYLSEWSMEGNYHMHALPSHFLLELMIAYGLKAERLYQNNQLTYSIDANGSFHARECAAELWNMQQGFLPTGRLHKPENLVRLRSFSDYIRLKSLNQKQALTPKNQSKWHSILSCGCVNHMYELNGRGYREIYEETRSVCLIKLYIVWLQTEQVPDCVLEYMYKEYDLKNVGHTSSKKLYGPLKQEILKKYPQIEQELYGKESKQQMISNWYRELAKIVSDHHSNYDQSVYYETEKIRERIDALFARPEWTKIQYEGELFEKIYLQLYKRKVMPVTLSNRLIEHFSLKGIWEDETKAEKLVEGLVQSTGFHYRMQEIDGIKTIVYEKTRVSDISDNNRDFWLYYLMTGYGMRQADIGMGANSAEYALGSDYYLPAYIEHMYYPSLQWRKLFTGWQNQQEKPLKQSAYEFTLPDQKRLRVEFHLHYCEYFLNGTPVIGPVYTFLEFKEYAEKIENTEQFFFLLALTFTPKEEQECARELIEKRLMRLPIHPITVPVIARLLAEGFEQLEQTSGYDGAHQYYQKTAPSFEARLPQKTEPEKSDNKQCIVQAIYYTEQEDYCLRAVVLDNSIILQHKKEFGWHGLPIDAFLTTKQVALMSLEQKKTWAKTFLETLRKPAPVSLVSYFLDGMENEEKAKKILKALKQQAEYNGSDELTENYCVLRFGMEKKNERLFYISFRPFSFMPSMHNPNFLTTSKFRLQELDRKIKEPHRIIGNFGWGDVYTPKEGFEPKPFAIGESGTYYQYDVIRMNRADNLAALLAKSIDLTNVTEVECYQGHLSISRLTHKLEYCFGERDFLESIHQPTMTTTDLFTKFTRAEMMKAFANWLDQLLAPEGLRLHLPYFVFEQKSVNVYALKLYDRTKFVDEQYSCQFASSKYDWQVDQTCSITPDSHTLIWKIWDSGDIGFIIPDEFNEILQWYMAYGKEGEKLKSCLAIDAAYTTKGQKLSGCFRLYKNIEGIYNAVKKRTAMTAYALTIDKKRKPTLFDSKFGGLPYWDVKKEYPTDSSGKKLMLVAQINLDQTPMPELLSGQGMLQFFGDGEAIFNRGFGSFDNQDQYQIIYHETIDYHVTREALEQLGIPDSAGPAYQTHMPISYERAVDIKQKTAYMGVEDYRFKKMFKAALEEEFDMQLPGVRRIFDDLLDDNEQYKLKMELSNASHWILGYPDFAVEDPRKRKSRLREYDRLLFQFDVHYLDDSYFSDTETCGIANFFISSEDLEREDFSRVMYNWECCERY